VGLANILSPTFPALGEFGYVRLGGRRAACRTCHIRIKRLGGYRVVDGGAAMRNVAQDQPPAKLKRKTDPVAKALRA
jgi:hypothetical protein